MVHNLESWVGLLLWMCTAFLGEGVELPGVHQAALSKALASAASAEKTVLFTLTDGNLAAQLFPVFLQSLKYTKEARHLLVVCQDEQAFDLCSKLHNSELCLKSVCEGAPLFRAESSEFHHKTLWRKAYVALAILELGYNVITLDVDLVTFKPLLPSIDWSQDLLASSDCNREEHNLTSAASSKFSPNSGVLFAKSTPAASRLFHKWLATQGEPGISSAQWGLWRALNQTRASELSYRTWGPPHVMASFCCHYCNGLVKELGLRRRDWRDVCPEDTRKDWVLFHAACIAWFQDDLDLQESFDLNMMKRDALLALWQLQMGTLL